MSHADDDGLNIPSAVVPYHIVIIPLLRGADSVSILEYCDEIKHRLPADIRALIDSKDETPQNKRWAYVRKGVPFILEIGKNETACRSVYFTERLSMIRTSTPIDEFVDNILALLQEHDEKLMQICEKNCRARWRDDISTADELLEALSGTSAGFVIAKWAGTEENMDLLSKVAATLRCIPLQQSGTTGKCVLTGKAASTDAIFAKSY
jgi:prolyl-tRNA synthetase